MGVPDLTPEFVKKYRELETERDNLRGELDKLKRPYEYLPPEPHGALAVCRYELGIEREKVRKLEEENDQLRDELHRAEGLKTPDHR